MDSKPYNARLNSLSEVWQDSPNLHEFSLDEGHYPRSSGGDVAYIYIQHKAATGLTIFFHGTGNDLLFSWQPLIKSFLNKGRSVLLMDLDGHGTGSSTTLTHEDFAQQADDLRTFLKAKGLDSLPTELVGYSLGALIILNGVFTKALKYDKIVLLALPEQIKVTPSFLLFELLSFFSPQFFRQLRTFGWRETIPAFGSFRRLSFPLRLDSKFRGSYPQFIARLFEHHPPSAYRPALGHNCLLVYGARDRLAPPPPNQDLGIAGPKIVVIDRANHFLLPFHKRTIEAISAWIG